MEAHVCHQLVDVGDRSGQITGHAVLAVAASQVRRECVTAQVEVYQHDPFARHGQRHCQIHRHERLARMGGGRSEEHALDLLARRYVHEGHVRTQDAESLGQCVAAGFPDDDAALVLAFEEGNVTQERGADVLFDVLAAADGRVEHADQVDDAEGDRKAGQQADAQDDHRTGRHGPGAAVCLVDRTRIAFGDGIVELRLLLFVEQVEEQLLLDLLLAHDV